MYPAVKAELPGAPGRFTSRARHRVVGKVVVESRSIIGCGFGVVMMTLFSIRSPGSSVGYAEGEAGHP